MRNHKKSLLNAFWIILALLSFIFVSDMDAQDSKLNSESHTLCGWRLVDGGAIRDCGEANE
jgi:hypothetical protein